jgi:ferrochelatase
MKIDTIVDIFRGVLKNTPYISFVNDVKIDPKRVKNGDLFIAINQDDIKLAVENGAYGIIFDKENIEIHDNEIAWIKVEDVNRSIFDYIRMYLSQNKKDIFFVTPFQIEILNQLNIKKIATIDVKNDNFFDTIVNEDTNIFLTDEDLVLKITKSFIDYRYMKIDKYDIINSSMFETTFKTKRNLYNKIKIPKFLLEELLQLEKMLKIIDIEINLSDIKFSEYFNPIFIDNNFTKKEFGKTQNVLILNHNPIYIDKQIDFLSQFKWAKIVLLSDEYDIVELNNKIKYYENIEDLIQKLKEIDFNIAIYYGKNSNIIENEINKEKEEVNLFSF